MLWQISVNCVSPNFFIGDKNMRCFLFLAICMHVCASMVYSQDTQDVVELKGGGTVKGEIIEIKDDILKIESYGKVYVFHLSEVERYYQEAVEVERRVEVPATVTKKETVIKKEPLGIFSGGKFRIGLGGEGLIMAKNIHYITVLLELQYPD